MLSSDFANLASEAARMLHDGADWLHMDIMVSTLSQFTSLPFPSLRCLYFVANRDFLYLPFFSFLFFCRMGTCPSNFHCYMIHYMLSLQNIVL